MEWEIVCMCDQLRAFEVGCYGNEVIRTPHIDRLAGECEALADNGAFIETSQGAIGLRTPTHLYGMQLEEDRRRISIVRAITVYSWVRRCSSILAVARHT